MPFKKNFHLAVVYDLVKVHKLILNYPKHFSTPKYLLFMKVMLENGWQCRVYEVKRSKYIFIRKKEEMYKIRFSNHKPLYLKEMENDCDFYVGVSHTQVSTTEQIISKLLYKNEQA